MQVRVEKRLPFGFKGEWGKVYKLYNTNEVVADVIQYQESSYYDIGDWIQLKSVENTTDKTTTITQQISNGQVKSSYKTIITTDAYFDNDTKKYECVMTIGDIVKAFGSYWVVDKLEEKSKYTPQKQTFYYVGVKQIFDKIVEG